MIGSTVYWLVVLTVFRRFSSADDAVACTAYRELGDFTLGALLSLHGSISENCDTEISPRGVVHAEAMVWAIRDINSRDDILPNITLGFDIRDDCRSEDVALWMSLMLLENISPDAFKDACPVLPLQSNLTLSTSHSEHEVIGIIGTSRSATSIPVAQLTGLFQVPIMSFWASSNELSDKARFPYFLRTVPPDRHQISAIVDMIVRFQWNYIALIHSVDSYGLHGARELLVLAEQRGICIAFTLPVNENPTQKELSEVVAKLVRYRYAKTVVMFAALQVANAVLDHVKSEQPGLNITWIGGDDWGFDLTERGLGDIAQGSLFTRFFSQTVPSFDDHFARLNPASDSVSPWFTNYTQTKRSGVFPDHPSSDYVVSPVVDGVYAFAHALDSLVAELCPERSDCPAIGGASGEMLKPHLLRVNFTGTGGLLFFDENADPPGKYILKNYQKMENGKYGSVEIGLWDSQIATTRLYLQDDLIRWQGDSLEVPRSTCIPDCSPGFILVPSQEKCCWLCQPCNDNEIVVNSSECVTCEFTTWPNSNRSGCEDILPSTLSFQDPIVIILLLCSIIGLLLTILTAAGLIHYNAKPLIKAASRELSSIVLVGVILAFLAVFLLLIKPSQGTCLASEATISLSFTLTYAPTLLKVNRIYRIFKASRVSVRRPKWISPRKLMAMAGVLILIQILIIVVSTSVSPVQAQVTVPVTPVDYLELYCTFSYEFLASCAYNLALILVCCYYAFMTRRVPDNYNESKFIAVSVYSTLVVCLATVPVYVTAVAVVQKVATLCAAVLLNGYLTLVCVYMTKLYAVKFVPKQQQDVHSTRTVAAAGAMASPARLAATISQTVGGAVGSASVGQIRPL
ncbi:metabotropic glutamate receptor 4-like [Patiria miniata]|uniref:G-protein coupled receptors family 3 profile domain-containing protein n=1 Tax=Patiria miniata TaxID=46514 RepID=A0A914B738_PATMI|nr:metabotropic glutamate receptor 4-like [Patiria miniata]